MRDLEMLLHESQKLIGDAESRMTRDLEAFLYRRAWQREKTIRLAFADLKATQMKRDALREQGHL